MLVLVVEDLRLTLWVLHFFRLNVHQDSSFPGGAHLGVIVHKIAILATIANGCTVKIVPVELSSGNAAIPDQLLKAEDHGSDNFISDVVLIEYLEKEAI